MPKYFMNGTKYAFYEHLMMETPHHRPVELKSRNRERKGIPPVKKLTDMVTTTERSG